MNQFDSLLAAAEYAVARCAGWSFAYSDEEYDKHSLLGIAEIHDEENPADEGSFYVALPGGSIGFCMDGEDIDWLFLPNPATGEDLPARFTAAAQAKFCSKCGNPVIPGARFCGACGARLG
ncbi:MAG: zinc ribbon domain-containing protein [Oscillospiraceae bacterium]|jgi:hypothetical protein